MLYNIENATEFVVIRDRLADNKKRRGRGQSDGAINCHPCQRQIRCHTGVNASSCCLGILQHLPNNFCGFAVIGHAVFSFGIRRGSPTVATEKVAHRAGLIARVAAAPVKRVKFGVIKAKLRNRTAGNIQYQACFVIFQHERTSALNSFFCQRLAKRPKKHSHYNPSEICHQNYCQFLRSLG